MPRLDSARIQRIQRIQRIREELPATGATVYLNNGSWGPLPRRSAAAIESEATRELEEGRVRGGMESFLTYFDDLAALRRMLAALIGASENEIALTRSTTEGVNLGIWGRAWAPGDEVVTTTAEHMGVLIPLAMLQRRYGVKITFADVGHGSAEQVLDALATAIHSGVKMVVLSHVLYTTGARLPLKEITEMAHSAGAIVHVDGAQTVGAMALDVHDLGIDQYAFSGQKWLCGPDATGGFFVRADQIEALNPTFPGFSSIDFRQFDAADPVTLVLKPDSSRFETGTFYRPAIAGLASSVEWLRDEVDFAAAIADIASLSVYCRERAREMPGVSVLTPAGQHAGLVAFQIGGADVDRAVDYLAARGTSIRNIHENNALRISTGFYNTTQEIDLALDQVREFMKMDM